MADELTRTLLPDSIEPRSEADAAVPTARPLQEKETDVATPCAELPPTLGPEVAPSDSATPIVRHFGDYELLAEIARGGMGVVFKARQKSLGRIVALKMILGSHLASPEQVRRFHIEAEEAGRLDHPNIVPIYQVGVEAGQHYFTMKLFEGGTLDEHMSRFQQDPKASIRLMATVARAVHYAHQHGILHRDLKPGNILLDADEQPHVTDFGLAKHLGEAGSQTQSGAVLGTPSYMAPEQAAARKDLSIVVDVYSLGAILFELLTGKPPFHASSTMETIRMVIESEPPRPRTLNARIDRDLETITLKCLEKNPQRRYPSAQMLAEDLERYLSGEPIRARPATRVERTVKWVRRRPATAALIGVASLALVSLLGLGIGYNIRLEAAYRDVDRQRQVALEQWKRAEEQREEAEHQRIRAEANDAEARRQSELVQSNLKKRLEIIDDFLFRMDGRLEKQAAPTSVRQEFLHDALQLSEGVLKERPKDPNARRQTARLYFSSADLWRKMSIFPEAESAFGKALKLQRELTAEFPEKADYRNELALTYAQNARLLRDLNRFKDAERAYEEAIRLEDELARQHPKDTGYRQRGALDCFRRADLLEASGQKPMAEAGYRDALKRQEKLIAEQASEPAFRADLAVTAASLAALLAQKDSAEGLPYLEKSVQARRQAYRLAPQAAEYAGDLRDSYLDLTFLLNKCGKHAELARMAEAYRVDFPDNSDETYNAACFMAWACRTAGECKQLPEMERKELIERYGSHAVKLLDMGIHEGYRDRSHMDWDTDLDPLRKRKDYRELVAAMDLRFPAPQTPKQEFEVLQREYQNAYSDYSSRLQQAQTVADKNKAKARQPHFEEFADRFFQLAEKLRDTGTAIEALLWVLENTASKPNLAAIRQRALEKLQRDHLQKPELSQVCNSLSKTPAPDCDELLRAALTKHAQADVRGLAGYALAQSLAQQAEQARQNNPSEGEALFQAAEQQYNEVIKKYGSVPTGKSSLGEVAKAKLHALSHLSIGRQAQEIEGKDLDGTPLKLSDYRGKVVVLDFWADWCGYCRQMYPQEKALVARMKDQPFVLLGVNCDDDLSQALRAVHKDQLTWRSWWNGSRSGERISKQWQVQAFPTIYVLDAKGIIRYKHEGVPDASMENTVQQLLKEAAKK
jgi:thiol-disulfide isomerase/thioredoxin/tRNA A-37 threonylcarbamoyl transferase component Bud32/tetratricopeptide (TPR) repeat protein